MQFDIKNLNNELEIGNVLTIFELPGIDREFILFSSENIETGDCNLNISYLDKNKDGYDIIVPIDDKNIYENAVNAVKDMLGVVCSEK